ncbi:MAG: DUF4238 domain-containing protein [Caldilineaceae bacterium]|nr:DUF4238 domain-containing protein [Caldilineaceae bacterium]
MIKHRQHYVWQNYLKAWCNADGLVQYSRNDEEPSTTNPKNVMVERHFYELQRLTDFDIEHLRFLIQHSGPPDLRSHHQELLRSFVLVANVYDLIKDKSTVPPAEREKIRKLLIEAEDRLHDGIEHSAVPILDQLRQQQSKFLDSHESAATFYFYIAHQYCRTKNIREPIRRYFSRQSILQTSANITNIHCYIMACNIGYNLFAEGESLEIVFLENKDPGFVTGDQPVINLLANRFGGDTMDYAFYYPLSPHLSCLLTHKTRNLSSKQIPATITNRLNGLVSWHSHQFLVGDSAATVQLAKNNRPTPNQTVRDVFDFLTVNP